MTEFNYGKERNLERYGVEEPPTIDFSKAESAGVPVAIYDAKSDLIIMPEDQKWIRDKLGSAVIDY